MAEGGEVVGRNRVPVDDDDGGIAEGTAEGPPDSERTEEIRARGEGIGGGCGEEDREEERDREKTETETKIEPVIKRPY